MPLYTAVAMIGMMPNISELMISNDLNVIVAGIRQGPTLRYPHESNPNITRTMANAVLQSVPMDRLSDDVAYRRAEATTRGLLPTPDLFESTDD